MIQLKVVIRSVTTKKNVEKIRLKYRNNQITLIYQLIIFRWRELLNRVTCCWLKEERLIRKDIRLLRSDVRQPLIFKVTYNLYVEKNAIRLIKYQKYQ
ncbi:hypothetical protein C0W28_18855, partial [Photobacterium kishitanii]